ncbi:MAG TPA: TlpA disulfide reductase family protein [Microthrixaceae bacterium]|nr:TlpA disulfide reductase family protein [Microthrixaceae bacterium]
MDTRTNRHRHPRPAPTSVVALLVAALLGLTAVGCNSSDDTTSSSGDDDTLAAVTVTPLADAPPLQLGSASKTPMVLNVWATWCAPCRKEMPAFDVTASKYEGVVRFVGVNLGDTEVAAQQFVDETGVGFDQYLDPDSTSQVALSITTMPATAFIRADGTIAATHNGALDEAELERLIADELGVPATTTTGP